MTVCIASLFQWNYAATDEPPDYGGAVLILSDRMITAGDIEYEPQQQKFARITPRIVALIAGDFSLHSQALIKIHEQVRADINAKPHDVAQMYGQAIQSLQQRMAEAKILAPLGLNTEMFHAQQKEFSDSFVTMIASQLQDFERTDVEALVVGFENNITHIYLIDRYGIVRCFDDVGFAAIGIGGWHARSRLMQSGYVNKATLGPALAATFAAKKAAEIAPGVGKTTDINLLIRDGMLPLWPKVAKKLGILYDEFEKARDAFATASVDKLREVLGDLKNYAPDTPTTADTQSAAKGPAQSDGNADSEAEGRSPPPRVDDSTKTP